MAIHTHRLRTRIYGGIFGLMLHCTLRFITTGSILEELPGGIPVYTMWYKDNFAKTTALREMRLGPGSEAKSG